MAAYLELVLDTTPPALVLEEATYDEGVVSVAFAVDEPASIAGLYEGFDGFSAPMEVEDGQLRAVLPGPPPGLVWVAAADEVMNVARVAAGVDHVAGGAGMLQLPSDSSPEVVPNPKTGQIERERI